MARDRTGSAARYDTVVDENEQSTYTLALELTGRNRRVLELGCASGYVSVALKRRGHTVVGVELDPEAAELARAVADSVIIADLDVEPLTSLVSGAEFDIVLAGDVLEHLRDPVTVLREAAAALAPDGFVVASLPNVAFVDLRLALLEGEWIYRSEGLLDETHLRFFTRASVFELAHRAGLIVTEVRRVIWTAGGSNVATKQPTLSQGLAELVLLDPNASTYQFVVKMERPTPLNTAAAEELDREMSEQEHIAALHIANEFAKRADEFATLREAQRELIALHQTKVMRMLARPRRWYGLVTTRRR